MARRGPYAKGVAKREEILGRALEVVAAQGYRGASVKEIADAVGLSQAGLLHYFDSKEELFTEILRKRDELETIAHKIPPLADTDWAGARATYLGVIAHNARVPGLVQLFSRLSVDAADPAHPAHDYFLQRTESLREVFAGLIRQAQADGAIDASLDPDLLARVVQAVSDGLQLQFLQDPAVDMAAAVEQLFAAISRTGD